MQLQSEHNGAQFKPDVTDDFPQRCAETEEENTIINESVQRIRDECQRLNYTVPQIMRLVTAGKYDLSESTVRNFFDTRNAHAPSQHTIDVLSAILFDTSRDEFDPAQAYRYYSECTELKISMTNAVQNAARIEAQCESLAARLSAYEDAVGFYRRQLEAAAREREMLLEMLKK